MVVPPHIVAFVQFFAGLGAVGFLLPAVRHREAKGRRGYGLFTGGIAIWMFAMAAANATTDLFITRSGLHFLLLGVEITAAGWLILALEITDRTTHLRQIAIGLGLGMALFQVALWTNPSHSFMYTIVVEPLRAGNFTEMTPTIDYGTGFWMHAIASYAAGLLAEGLLVYEVFRSGGLRRKQFLWLSLAAVPVIIGSVISTWGLLDLPYNVSSFGFLLAVPLLAGVIFKTRFLDIVPVARRTVMAELDDAVITIDTENRVVDANKRALELFEPGSDYVGMAPGEFFEPIAEAILSQLDHPDAGDTEVTIDLDGEPHHFSVSISPISAELASGRIVILHDITTQKRRETELSRQNERLDEFTSFVSHDLRNPLHVAQGFVEATRETGDLEHLDPVVESHDRMETMIDDLLTLAKAKTVVDDPAPIALASLVEDAWQTTRTEGGSLRRDFEEATVKGNADLLQHVFENLFRNALDHNEPPVTVTVGLLPNGDGFFVADDGTGIPPKARETVFDRGHTTSETGTGLGLAIVADLVQAHGWSIDVTESDQGGARFEITDVEVVS